MTSQTAPTNPPQRTDPRSALPRLDRHKPRCGPVRKSRAGRWRAAVLIGVHVLIGLHVWHWLVAGRTLTPVEPSEAMQTFELGRINAGFVLFAVAILGTLVFGRWFCGWACHVVAVQDLSAWLLGRVGLRPRPVRSRLLVLAPWAVAFYMFGWPHVEPWLDPATPRLARFADWDWALTTESLWQTFPGPLMSVLTFVVVGFLMVFWLGAKGFCTHGCPYGAFFAIADRFAPMRIKVSPSCDACGHCTQVCSSNVRVHEEVARHGMIVDPGCMKCLDCVSVCPKSALSFGVARPRPFTASQQRSPARADFGWHEEALLAVVAVAACMGFRGAWFWEGVPFLLSVGLGVLTAAVAVTLLRAIRQPDLQFQHWAWKRAGRLTRAGWVGVAGGALWLLFAAHTGVGRWLVAVGDGHAQRLMRAELAPAERMDLLRQTAASFARAEGWLLVANPHVHLMQGLALREFGEYGAAEQQLRRALVLRPDWPSAAIPLCDLLNLRSQWDEAERILRRQLELDPELTAAKQRLQMLEAARARGR